MLINFLMHLRAFGLPISIRGFLILLETMENSLIGYRISEFYLLTGIYLIKDEKYFSKFYIAFKQSFVAVSKLPNDFDPLISEAWLKNDFYKRLTEEEKNNLLR